MISPLPMMSDKKRKRIPRRETNREAKEEGVKSPLVVENEPEIARKGTCCGNIRHTCMYKIN